ncbi:MAG TPA: glycine--tRNA ligase [bacterium]|nr:glycine--tRNA ligase [bacterium]
MSGRDDLQQKIVSLCKRRGFVFPGSEIYGGLANTYDYGPLGVLMLRNIINDWWSFFITKRKDIYALDTSVLMAPQVWEASGHTKSFTDALIDCKECKNRTRADHLIERYLEENNLLKDVEGEGMDVLEELINKHKIPCPVCSKFNWTKPRRFNLLFETHMGILEDNKSLAYLRGEIAQGMFINFKNVLETMRPKLPFGIAQSGKAFRNEITLGNFIFRTVEFNLAEFEYFFNPNKDSWEEVFNYWKDLMLEWITSLGIPGDMLKWRIHTDKERAHYSARTEDLDYSFGFGFKELFGLAYRTDYDLKNHMEKSGIDLRYTDPETGDKVIPHVIEPTFGISRVFLALLNNGYYEEKERLVLKLDKRISPYKAAVFPLVKNKEDIVSKAQEVFNELISKGISVDWDDRGNIGKRYFSQDEIGTPFCITVDYQTLEDSTVTIRDRDTMKQERILISDISNRLN